jgi:hypothetical protein
LEQHSNRTEDCALPEFIYIYKIPKGRQLWQEEDEEGKFYPKLPIMKGANRLYSLHWKART